MHCGSCRQPKEAYFTEGKGLFGRDRHPKECDCQSKCGEFSNAAMRQWTFENDNGKCPQMDRAHFYAANWEEMKAENIGYLLWGKV